MKEEEKPFFACSAFLFFFSLIFCPLFFFCEDAVKREMELSMLAANNNGVLDMSNHQLKEVPQQVCVCCFVVCVSVRAHLYRACGSVLGQMCT